MNYFEFAAEAAVVLLTGTGLLLNSGILKHGFRKDMFFYYTNLSNLWAFMFFSGRIICRFLNTRPVLFESDIVYYVTAVAITVTFIVYNFVLLPAIKKDPESFGAFGNYRRYANLAVHYFSPLLTLLNWILFAGKNLPLCKSLICWLCVPVFYMIIAMLRGSSGINLSGSSSPYPYTFMDPTVLGVKKVTVNIIVMFFAFALLGLAFWGLAAMMR